MTVLTRSLALVLIAGLLAGDRAFAEAEPDELADMSLEELLDIEITTASKQSESLSESPSFTHVITRKEIVDYGYRTLSEALSGIIGLYHTSADLVWDGLGVRGFAVAGDYSTRVLVLIDGQRLNEPFGDAPSLGEELPLDLEGIERIEVVKGPGSALYGSNALLGVVNIVPRRGEAIDGVEARLDTGSFDRTKGTLTAGKRFDNGLEVAALVGGLRSDGNDFLQVQGLGTARDSDGEEAIRGHLFASYEGFTLGVYASNREKQDPTGAYETIFDSPFDGTWIEEEQVVTQLRYERDVLPQLEGQFVGRLFHKVYDYQGDYEYDEECCDEVVPYLNHDRATTKSYGGELQLSLSPREGLGLTAGLEAWHHYEIDYSNSDIFGVYVDGSDPYHSMAGYLQAQFQATDWMRVILGSRFDDYSEFDMEVSPRAAVVLTPREGTTVKLLYGRAFRAPNVFESVYDDGDHVAPSETLVPETITTYELVFDQELFSHTRFVGSVFHYSLDDLIAEFTNSDESFEFRNSGTVTSRGVELMLQTALPGGVRGQVGFTALRAEDDDGDWLPNSPKFLGNLTVSAPLWQERLHAALEFRAIGRRKTLAGSKLPPAFPLNLVMRFQVLEWLETSVGVYDVFDDDVRVPGGFQQLANGTEFLRLRGRSLNASVRARF